MNLGVSLANGLDGTGEATLAVGVVEPVSSPLPRVDEVAAAGLCSALSIPGVRRWSVRESLRRRVESDLPQERLPDRRRIVE